MRTNRLASSSLFRRTAVVAGVSALALLGAAPAGASTPGRVNDTRDGFSFALPSGWHQVSLTGNTVGQLLGAARQASPKLKQALSNSLTTQFKQNVKVYATSTTQTAGVFSNVNVIEESGTAPISQMQQIDRQGLTQVGGKSIKVKTTSYGFGQAVVGTYVLPVQGVNVYGAQVYASHGGSTFVITFSSGTASASNRYAAQIMRSWRFFTPKG